MKNLRQTLHKTMASLRRVGRWSWRRPFWLKFSAGLILLVVLFSFGALQLHQQIYQLNTKEAKLLGKPSVDTGKISENSDTVKYNRADESGDTKKQSLVTAGAADASGAFPYHATLTKTGDKTITFSDTTGDRSFTLKPLDGQGAGKLVDGRVIYPAGSSQKQIYTFKRNGIKADILLSSAPGKIAQWRWQLGLGDKLEAKLLPDGGVGIYSASETLYGNVQAADAKSQELLDKARQKNKSELLFVLPAPYIKDAEGREIHEDTYFKLDGDVLTLIANNLKNKNYPLTIDPSVTVTTTAQFQTSYYEDGMIDNSTSDQIGRSAVSIGTLAANTPQASAFTTGRHDHTSVVYNGYIYVIGGCSVSDNPCTTFLNDIQYAWLDSSTGAACLPSNHATCTGTVFASTSSFASARYRLASSVYNGNLYISGGRAANSATGCDASGFCSDVIHCPINASDGSLGTCLQQTGVIIGGGRESLTTAAYNGYLYIPGGSFNGTAQSDVQHCPINADGSVGTCIQQNSVIPARMAMGTVAYNGYLYAVGGYDGSSYNNDITHCFINSDGSVSNCVTQAAVFTTGRAWFATTVMDGYMYVAGGHIATGALGDTQYMAIRADGSVATGVSTNTFTTSRQGLSMVAYKGYIYDLGGNTGTFQNDVQRLAINSGSQFLGATGTTSQQTNSFTTVRTASGGVAYNGRVYIIGGVNGATAQNDIQWSQINSDGSLSCPSGQTCATGVFTQQNGILNVGRYFHAVAVYNGYIYAMGGNQQGGATLNDVEHCKINTDGSISSCVRQTTAFTTARLALAGAAYNGYLYITGGQGCGTYCSDVQYGWLDPSTGAVCLPSNHATCSGTVFTQQTAAFTTARQVHTTVTYNGYIYIIGGTNGTLQNDVQYGWLDPSTGAVCLPSNHATCSGTVFTQQTAAFTTARQGHSSVVYNGYIYIIGGCTNAGACTTVTADITRCQINSNGSVTTPCTSVAGAFTTARFGQASAAANGYIFIMGGCSAGDCTTHNNDSQHLAAQAPSYSAHYERMVDIGRTVDSVDSIQFNGSAPCNNVSINYSTADSSGVFGAMTNASPGAASGTSYSLSGVTLMRYVLVDFGLDDSSCGGSANIADFTVNYTLLPPDAPTLLTPAAGAISLGTNPSFTLKTTDALDNYGQYKIQIFNTSSGVCNTGSQVGSDIDESASHTGWTGEDANGSTAYTIGTTIGAATTATYSGSPTLSYNTSYCWRAAAMDPGGSATFGSYSATQLFSTNFSPYAPTLTVPADTQTGLSTTPEFRMFSNDPDNDFVKYRFVICSSNVNCVWGGTVTQSIDQTSSQTGWKAQSNSCTNSYSSGQEAIHQLQTPLAANTTYYWRAYAIDPCGTNLWGSGNAVLGTFTTNATSPKPQINIRGGSGTVNIYGGTTIGR